MFLIGRRLIVASERREAKPRRSAGMGSPACARTPKVSGLARGRARVERRGAERSVSRAVVGAWRDVCLQSMRTTVVSPDRLASLYRADSTDHSVRA